MSALRLVLSSTLLLTACAEQAEREEVIQKLRPLGVAINPPVAAPGTEVELTFHLAAPHGAAVTAEPAPPDSRGLGALPVEDLTLATGEAVETPYAGFVHTVVSGRFTVPAVPPLGPGQAARLRYGARFRADGAEVAVVGDVFVFPPQSPELEWQAPTVAITAPEGPVAPGSDVAIRGDIARGHEEEMKIGWFVTGGEIKNRRARETTWKAPASGSHTLVLTARGRKSKAFAIAIRDVAVQ